MNRSRPQVETAKRPVRVSVLIPAYHEEPTIGDVVRRVRGVDLSALGLEKEIIVCDDGSTDVTSEKVERAAEGDPCLRLVRHARNQGKGAALRTALQHATGDVIIIQDADLEYSVGDYCELLAPIIEGRADVVYGSRFLRARWPTGMRVANFVANRILTATANVLFKHAITDEATAFKVFRTDVLRSLALEADGFDFCPEVTAKLGLRGIPIVEVPVSYAARTSIAGKKVRWTDGVRAFMLLLRHRFVRPAPIDSRQHPTIPVVGVKHLAGRPTLLDGRASTS
jgi:dolichol-phosphate mannosyltransferase